MQMIGCLFFSYNSIHLFAFFAANYGFFCRFFTTTLGKSHLPTFYFASLRGHILIVVKDLECLRSSRKARVCSLRVGTSFDLQALEFI